MIEPPDRCSDVGVTLDAGDLTLGYRREAVIHHASIAVRPGRVTALIGPNGSGKSTLLRALARLHKPTSGTIAIDDEPTDALTSREFARRVTLLAQSRPSAGGICVRDVVGYGRHPYRGRFSGTDPDGPEAVAWAMGVTGVDHLAQRSIGDLSGGEQQRVWLATCLAQQTGVLLLDEPTTFLDLRFQVEILDLVRDLADDHQVGVGVVLHDLQQAADVADEVVLLESGRVVAAGLPADVLTAERLSAVYGIRIDVGVGLDGSLTTRPTGRHSRTRVA